MSATPKARIWIGFFSASGSPALHITIQGISGKTVPFEAILDTGFTGFVCMPLLKALQLGLMFYGTTWVELADGSKSIKLTAKGAVQIGDELAAGVVILEPKATEVLLGMSFLRLFKRTLILSDRAVFLTPETYPIPAVDEPA